MSLFKSLFGPRRQEVWAALQAQIGGEVTPGNWWHGEKLTATAGEWMVTLDEYTVVTMVGKVTVPIACTRLRAPFPNPRRFRLSIYRASIFSALGTLLGMQDIQVGFPEFDADFVIKGSSEESMRTLFASERLRALVAAQPKFNLHIEDDDGWFGKSYPPDVDVLTFNVAGSIRDAEQLKGLYDVFAETLERLSEMGIAGRGTGGVNAEAGR